MAITNDDDGTELPPIDGTYIPNEPEKQAPQEAEPKLTVYRSHKTPPNDTDAEDAALGAAFLRVESADAVAAADPEDFYKVANKPIVVAIATLRAQDKPVDPVFVRDELRKMGKLQHVGDDFRLVNLVANAPSHHADKYLDIIHRNATCRRLIEFAPTLEHFGFKGDPEKCLEVLEGATQLFRPNVTQQIWETIDMQAVVDDTEVDDPPTMLTRTDGQCLIYPGKVHAFNAATESGKSWLALYACAERIKAQDHVLYIDFEDSPRGITQRLQDLGLDKTEIVKFFHYMRPNDPISATSKAVVRKALAEFQPVLCVIDGVTEVMAMNGWSINDNDDVAKFYEALARPIARTGCAVVLIDHVTKEREHRGPFAIGGQHKLAGIDGAAYGLEVIRPFGRELDGLAKITVSKDRPGFVRGASAGGYVAASMRLVSKGGMLNFALTAPDGIGGGDESKLAEVMEKLSKFMEYQNEPLSRNGLRNAIKGRRGSVIEAINVMINDRHLIETDHRGGYPRYRLGEPFVAYPEPEPLQQEMEDF